MRIMNEMVVRAVLVFGLIGMSQAPLAFADTTGFISIPASAFSEKSSSSSGGNNSYRGNNTGTSRSFHSGNLFAPLNLPHGAIITSLTCGSTSLPGWRTFFVLRRNEPQQANVDMATIHTSGDGRVKYEFLNTTSITSPNIDNSRFNYYIVAAISMRLGEIPGFSNCDRGRCGNVNFCSVGYTIVERDPGEGAGKVKVDDNGPGSIEIIR